MKRIRVSCVLGAIVLCWISIGVGQEWRRIESRDRGKEFIGFVQPEQLYWRPFALPSVQLAEFKLLSFDESSQARTQLLRIPPGWRQPMGYHSSDLEMFVLEGGIKVGEKPMGRYSYVYYPAGHAYGSMSSEFGATILQFWDGAPDFVQSAHSKPGAREDAVIEGWNYGDSPTIGPSKFPKFQNEPAWDNSPVRMKLIRHDKSTGRMTWIVMTPGGGPSMSGEGKLPVWKSTPGWQEGYLIAGDMTIGECLDAGEVAGSYAPGGYFFRPGGIRHGGLSQYSSTFALWLFRSGKQHWVDRFSTCEKPASVAVNEQDKGDAQR